MGVAGVQTHGFVGGVHLIELPQKFIGVRKDIPDTGPFDAGGAEGFEGDVDLVLFGVGDDIFEHFIGNATHHLGWLLAPAGGVDKMDDAGGRPQNGGSLQILFADLVGPFAARLVHGVVGFAPTVGLPDL